MLKLRNGFQTLLGKDDMEKSWGSDYTTFCYILRKIEASEWYLVTQKALLRDLRVCLMEPLKQQGLYKLKAVYLTSQR